jgi:integrase
VDIRPSLDHGWTEVVMAKRVKEVALSTRTARGKLAPRHKPYFRLIADGVHLGYRRSIVMNRAGTWLARRYLTEGAYETHVLGIADDTPDAPADGKKILTFDEAQSAVREWARAKTLAHRAVTRDVATVRNAIAAYLAERAARSPERAHNAELRLKHHVLEAKLADVGLHDLLEKHFIDWRKGLKRGGRGKAANGDPLAPATLARLLNDLRAALSLGARKAKVPADVVTAIKDGLKAPEAPGRARAKQVLPDADVRRLVDAAARQDQDFGALVLVLAATGARLDQVARITVADFQPDVRRLMVPVSRKGRGTKQITHTAVPLPDDAVARIRPLTAGRAGHEPLLMHWHHRQLKGDKQHGVAPRWERVDRRPWKDAAEMTRNWKATVIVAGLPASLVPYCLRHSAIVRMLRAGLPVTLVAKVHDTSATMIHLHYAVYIMDATEDLLRRAVLPMGVGEVIQLQTVA